MFAGEIQNDLIISKSCIAGLILITALMKLLSTAWYNLVGSIIANQAFFCAFFHPPSDTSFTVSLDFWHQILAPSRHFDTRQDKEAAVMTKIIASVTIILS